MICLDNRLLEVLWHRLFGCYIFEVSEVIAFQVVDGTFRETRVVISIYFLIRTREDVLIGVDGCAIIYLTIG